MDEQESAETTPLKMSTSDSLRNMASSTASVGQNNFSKEKGDTQEDLIASGKRMSSTLLSSGKENTDYYYYNDHTISHNFQPHHHHQVDSKCIMIEKSKSTPTLLTPQSLSGTAFASHYLNPTASMGQSAASMTNQPSSIMHQQLNGSNQNQNPHLHTMQDMTSPNMTGLSVGPIRGGDSFMMTASSSQHSTMGTGSLGPGAHHGRLHHLQSIKTVGFYSVNITIISCCHKCSDTIHRVGFFRLNYFPIIELFRQCWHPFSYFLLISLNAFFVFCHF